MHESATAFGLYAHDPGRFVSTVKTPRRYRNVVKVEGIEPLLLEWEEDVCEVCGAHVGYGVRLFHLGRCDEHAESSDEEGDEL